MKHHIIELARLRKRIESHRLAYGVPLALKRSGRQGGKIEIRNSVDPAEDPIWTARIRDLISGASDTEAELDRFIATGFRIYAWSLLSERGFGFADGDEANWDVDDFRIRSHARFREDDGFYLELHLSVGGICRVQQWIQFRKWPSPAELAGFMESLKKSHTELTNFESFLKGTNTHYEIVNGAIAFGRFV